MVSVTVHSIQKNLCFNTNRILDIKANIFATPTLHVIVHIIDMLIMTLAFNALRLCVVLRAIHPQLGETEKFHRRVR